MADAACALSVAFEVERTADRDASPDLLFRSHLQSFHPFRWLAACHFQGNRVGGGKSLRFLHLASSNTVESAAMGIAERIKVMIVDDQVTSRLLLTDALQKLGFRHINVARDGQEALDMLIREQNHLVISDFNMPKMDGLQLLKAVRENASTKKSAFIILTAQGDRALVQKAAALGANGIVALTARRFTCAILRHDPSRS